MNIERTWAREAAGLNETCRECPRVVWELPEAALGCGELEARKVARWLKPAPAVIVALLVLACVSLAAFDLVLLASRTAIAV